MNSKIDNYIRSLFLTNGRLFIQVQGLPENGIHRHPILPFLCDIRRKRQYILTKEL
jgi:hypothetical protein